MTCDLFRDFHEELGTGRWRRGLGIFIPVAFALRILDLHEDHSQTSTNRTNTPIWTFMKPNDLEWPSPICT